jgi:hypothetical protein
MFKLIFKAMVIILFTVFLMVALAFWKGGEPFRIFGEGTLVVGQKIMEFGDFVDDLRKGVKKKRKKIEQIKDEISSKGETGNEIVITRQWNL